MIFLLFNIFSEILSPESINFLSSEDRKLCRQILSSESRNGLLNYFLHQEDSLLRVVKNPEEKYAHNNNGKNFLTKFAINFLKKELDDELKNTIESIGNNFIAPNDQKCKHVLKYFNYLYSSSVSHESIFDNYDDYKKIFLTNIPINNFSEDEINTAFSVITSKENVFFLKKIIRVINLFENGISKKIVKFFDNIIQVPRIISDEDFSKEYLLEFSIQEINLSQGLLPLEKISDKRQKNETIEMRKTYSSSRKKIVSFFLHLMDNSDFKSILTDSAQYQEWLIENLFKERKEALEFYNFFNKDALIAIKKILKKFKAYGDKTLISKFIVKKALDNKISIQGNWNLGAYLANLSMPEEAVLEDKCLIIFYILFKEMKKNNPNYNTENDLLTLILHELNNLNKKNTQQKKEKIEEKHKEFIRKDNQLKEKSAKNKETTDVYFNSLNKKYDFIKTILEVYNKRSIGRWDYFIKSFEAYSQERVLGEKYTIEKLKYTHRIDAMPLNKKMSLKNELEVLGLNKEILEDEILLKKFMYKNLSEVDINYINNVFSSEHVDQLFQVLKSRYMHEGKKDKRQFFFEQVLQAISNQGTVTDKIKLPNLTSIKNSKTLNPSDKKRFIRMFFKGMYDYLSNSSKNTIGIEDMCSFVEEFKYTDDYLGDS